MNKNIVLATLFAAVAFFPLSTTPGHAASCADELKVVESKVKVSHEGEVRDWQGAQNYIVQAQKALAANDDAKCKQQVEVARKNLRDSRDSGNDNSNDD